MCIPSDADRYSAMELALVCPKCASEGLVAWEHLDRRLICRGCWTVYRVEPNGLVEVEQQECERILVAVRTGSSEWRRHEAVIERAPGVADRLRDVGVHILTSWTGRLSLAAVVMLVGILWGTGRLSRPPVAVSAARLPDSLDERATLLAEAVARRDMTLLVQLTDPSQHRALRIWLAHGKDLPKEVPAESPGIESDVVARTKSGASGGTKVRVRLRLPPDGEEFVLNEQWVQRAESWYFRPTIVRSPAPPKTFELQPKGRRR
ncbi:MAG: hypothetical protein HYX69_05900 [Planctomycetia bacterium]|nr:hypothetical protein [Planctomycetia bacterium]